MNFWQKLKKPIMVLAPMANVTDPAFRRIIAKYGKPDVMWTEFVSADGLFLGGYDALIKDLAFSETERPIVAQFFTSKPDIMERAVKLAVELGFDGIDINMGCPDKSIEKQGAGAKLITNPKLAQEIIYAAKRGAENLPVSVKTRVGWSKNELEILLPALLETNPAVITVHARTRKELSLVPARWEYVKRAVEIRDNFIDLNGKKSETLILGNGDVKDLDDAKKKVKETGCDGVMLGRAIFGNPWLFAGKDNNAKFSQVLGASQPDCSKILIDIVSEKLHVMVEHTKLFEELFCPPKTDLQSKSVRPTPKVFRHKNFAIMKKHYKAYVTGWDGAKELRMKLMETKNAGEVEAIVEDFIRGYS